MKKTIAILLLIMLSTSVLCEEITITCPATVKTTNPFGAWNNGASGWRGQEADKIIWYVRTHYVNPQGFLRCHYGPVGSAPVYVYEKDTPDGMVCAANSPVKTFTCKTKRIPPRPIPRPVVRPINR